MDGNTIHHTAAIASAVLGVHSAQLSNMDMVVRTYTPVNNIGLKKNIDWITSSSAINCNRTMLKGNNHVEGIALHTQNLATTPSTNEALVNHWKFQVKI